MLLRNSDSITIVLTKKYKYWSKLKHLRISWNYSSFVPKSFVNKWGKPINKCQINKEFSFSHIANGILDMFTTQPELRAEWIRKECCDFNAILSLEKKNYYHYAMGRIKLLTYAVL